uniref:Uncharacterized protein n=1 Tax=Daphnia magna TaxID=35525 RepID=A0A0P6CRD0_9CRUS
MRLIPRAASPRHSVLYFYFTIDFLPFLFAIFRQLLHILLLLPSVQDWQGSLLRYIVHVFYSVVFTLTWRRLEFLDTLIFLTPSFLT